MSAAILVVFGMSPDFHSSGELPSVLILRPAYLVTMM
jgi:hypothetical protein